MAEPFISCSNESFVLSTGGCPAILNTNFRQSVYCFEPVWASVLVVYESYGLPNIFPNPLMPAYPFLASCDREGPTHRIEEFYHRRLRRTPVGTPPATWMFDYRHRYMKFFNVVPYRLVHSDGNESQAVVRIGERLDTALASDAKRPNHPGSGTPLTVVVLECRRTSFWSGFAKRWIMRAGRSNYLCRRAQMSKVSEKPNLDNVVGPAKSNRRWHVYLHE